MTTGKSFSAVLIALALSSATELFAQQPTTPTRGTVKVQPRYFNPFNVEATRLRMDPFGFFTLLPTLPTIANPAAAFTASTATTGVPVPAPAAVTTAGSGSDSPGSTTTVAPSFRPDPRSPFRPPTRPPFM